jgi:uncharacterized protein YbaR (Trm112 family)
MSSMPCPACKHPLGLTLEFISKHPISMCPNCQTMFNFEVGDEIKESLANALSDINKIKKQYKGTVKFS